MQSKSIVIDTNIVLKWFLEENEEDFLRARSVYELVKKGELRVIAPSFIFVELANILLRKKHLLPEQVSKALFLLQTSGISFESSESNHAEWLDVAVTYGLTSYDALYVALAKKTHCSLLTEDKKILTSFPQSISLSQMTQ